MCQDCSAATATANLHNHTTDRSHIETSMQPITSIAGHHQRHRLIARLPESLVGLRMSVQLAAAVICVRSQ